MTLTIRNDEIYDQNGNWLKTISCPKKLAIKDLDRGPRGNFSCKFYERIIHNTDLMSEQQIVELSSHEAVKSPRRYTVRRE